MIARLLILAFLGAFLPLVHARLGETEGQSQIRYGQPREDMTGANDKPLMPGAIEKVYHYQGWRVRSAFANGACVRIEYVHLSEENFPKAVTDREISAILDAEKGKFSWKEEKATKQPGPAGEIEKALKGAFHMRKWIRSDRATAELALGLVIKLQDRDADDTARKLLRQVQEKEKQAGAVGDLPKF